MFLSKPKTLALSGILIAVIPNMAWASDMSALFGMLVLVWASHFWPFFLPLFFLANSGSKLKAYLILTVFSLGIKGLVYLPLQLLQQYVSVKLAFEGPIVSVLELAIIIIPVSAFFIAWAALAVYAKKILVKTEAPVA